MRFLILSFILTLFFIQCKNDATPKEQSLPQSEGLTPEPVKLPKTLSDSLTFHQWTLDRIELGNKNNPFLSSIANDKNTSTWSFKSDSSFLIEIGNNKAQGLWLLDADKRTMITEFGRKRTQYTIQNLKGNTLQLYVKEAEATLVLSE